MNPKPIMALTLLQPYASLVARGAKQYESRSWSTPYRGPLVIHAGANKSYIHDHMRNFYAEPFRTFLTQAGIQNILALPFGCGLCVVDLVECIDTARIAGVLGARERAFGDYSPGRYAWKLANLRPFAQPVRCRGKQSLWEWPYRLPAAFGVDGGPTSEQLSLLPEAEW